MKNESLMRSRSDSYTISTPIFTADQLPDANEVNPTPHKTEPVQDKPESISEPTEAIQQSIEKIPEKIVNIDDQTEKESIENETTQEKTFSTSDMIQSQLKTQLTDLIKKQKHEYFLAMQILKRKFEDEQLDFLQKLQNTNMTSTPLTNVSLVPTEDEEFTEFQTCLQSVVSADSEITLTNDQDTKEKAATIINKYARGFLVRRLMRTSYVNECINNISDTLNLVFTLKDTSPIQKSVKSHLYETLKGDLYRLHDVFFANSTKEKMNLITFDRENRQKKLAQLNKEKTFQ